VRPRSTIRKGRIIRAAFTASDLGNKYNYIYCLPPRGEGEGKDRTAKGQNPRKFQIRNSQITSTQKTVIATPQSPRGEGEPFAGGLADGMSGAVGGLIRESGGGPHALRDAPRVRVVAGVSPASRSAPALWRFGGQAADQRAPGRRRLGLANGWVEASGMGWCWRRAEAGPVAVREG
jgi:hypothetical protein